MKIKALVLSALLALLLFGINSCKKDEKDLNSYFSAVTCNEADDTLNTYSGKIKTILDFNCAKAGCHDAVTKEEGKDFSTYTTAKNAFDAEALCAINHESGCEPMPDGLPKLGDDVIHDLTCWAKNGYPQ